MREWKILDVDGNVLHQGHAATKRDFVQKLIEKNISLAKADFSNDSTTLEHMNLENVDLRAACLDNCSLRASVLKKARLQGASMKNCKLICANLENAHLDNCDLTNADLTSVVATRASFRSTIITKTNFTKMAASSSLFTYARGREPIFVDAKLKNVNFSDCKMISPDFSGADLRHQMLGVKDEENDKNEQLAQHFPNRTQGSIVVGGVYDKETQFSKTVPAMLSDRKTSRLAKMALWTSTSLGMFVLAEHASEMLSEIGISPSHGAGVGVVAFVGAIYFLKEIASEYTRDLLVDKLTDVAYKVRQCFKDADRVGTHRMHLVCAMAKDMSCAPLKMALDATAQQAKKRGFWSSFKSFWCKLGHVVVCDRRHLAVALSTLSSNRRQTCELPRDVILIRCDKSKHKSLTHNHSHDYNSGPCVLSFLKDGKSTAIWPLANNLHAKIVYNEAGELIKCYDHMGVETDAETLGLPYASCSRLDAAFAFEADLLEEHGLKDFHYPRETHSILVGQDGSILVQKESDRRLDNPYSHALIKPDRSGLYVTRGALQEEEKHLSKLLKKQKLSSKPTANNSENLLESDFVPAM